MWIGIYSKQNPWCLDTLGSVTRIKNPVTYPETNTICDGKEMIHKTTSLLAWPQDAAAIWVWLEVWAMKKSLQHLACLPQLLLELSWYPWKCIEILHLLCKGVLGDSENILPFLSLVTVDDLYRSSHTGDLAKKLLFEALQGPSPASLLWGAAYSSASAPQKIFFFSSPGENVKGLCDKQVWVGAWGSPPRSQDTAQIHSQLPCKIENILLKYFCRLHLFSTPTNLLLPWYCCLLMCFSFR